MPSRQDSKRSSKLGDLCYNQKSTSKPVYKSDIPMARTRSPIPSDLVLESTLASRLNQLRQFRNLSKKELAQAVRMTEERIDDIESGLETWLSAAERQIIAKALYIDPNLLKEVEYRPADSSHPSYASMSVEINTSLTDSILSGMRDLACPQCGNTLRCSVQKRVDINGE